jgi:hypothetical protein
MKRYLFKAALGVVGLAVVTTACQNGGRFVPTTASQIADADASSDLTDRARAMGYDVATPDGVPKCPAPMGRLPGTYTTLVAEGNVKKGTFRVSGGLAEYIVDRLTKATPAPSPSPTPTAGPTPTKGPKPPPEYLYYGAYSLKKGPGGCAYLVTTVSGKPEKGSKDNAVALGFPNIDKNYNTKVLLEGPLKMTVTGLSAKGGSGTIVLLTKKGATYNTGTVTLVGRLTER